MKIKNNKTDNDNFLCKFYELKNKNDCTYLNNYADIIDICTLNSCLRVVTYVESPSEARRFT